MLDVPGTCYEHLVIPELHPALEHRPASVILPSIEPDVIDLLRIACFLRKVLDILAGDSVRWQLIGNLLPVALCLYVEVETVSGINCCLCHNCEFCFYRLSLSPEGDEFFPFLRLLECKLFFISFIG